MVGRSRPWPLDQTPGIVGVALGMHRVARQLLHRAPRFGRSRSAKWLDRRKFDRILAVVGALALEKANTESMSE